MTRMEILYTKTTKRVSLPPDTGASGSHRWFMKFSILKWRDEELNGISEVIPHGSLNYLFWVNQTIQMYGKLCWYYNDPCTKMYPLFCFQDLPKGATFFPEGCQWPPCLRVLNCIPCKVLVCTHARLEATSFCVEANMGSIRKGLALGSIVYTTQWSKYTQRNEKNPYQQGILVLGLSSQGIFCSSYVIHAVGTLLMSCSFQRHVLTLTGGTRATCV